MPTAFANSLNLPSPFVLIVAGYIGLRALEIALRPQEAFRNRTAHKLMTLSATGLFLLVVLFLVAEISWRIGSDLTAVASPWDILKHSTKPTLAGLRDLRSFVACNWVPTS